MQEEKINDNRFYTGIGSRETPLDILFLMVKFANIMEKKGFILRSGSAKGADYAFEAGVEDVKNNAEIYVPDLNFGTFKFKLKNPDYFIPEKHNPDAYQKANKLLSVHELHPRWNYTMADYPRKLHNRNIFQVLGKNCEDNPSLSVKSKFILCYTGDGVSKAKDTTIKTGGTGTAIRAGDHFKVETFNLKNPDHLKRISDFVDKNDHLINYDYIKNIVLRTDLNPHCQSIEELFFNENLLNEHNVKKNKRPRPQVA